VNHEVGVVDDVEQGRLPRDESGSLMKTLRLTDGTVCCLGSIPVVRSKRPQLVDDIFMRDIGEGGRRERSCHRG
jgi:hypothetical protein